MAAGTTSLFPARVPAKRLRKVEEILARLGMKPGDAFNMLLARTELREELPFEVNTRRMGELNPAQMAEVENRAAVVAGFVKSDSSQIRCSKLDVRHPMRSSYRTARETERSDEKTTYPKRL